MSNDATPGPATQSPRKAASRSFDPSVLVGVRYKVTKGCLALGVRKGETFRVRDARYLKGTGYSVQLAGEGRGLTLWAQSSARLTRELSLHNGNPLNRVRLARVEEASTEPVKPPVPAPVNPLDEKEALWRGATLLVQEKHLRIVKARFNRDSPLALRLCAVIRELGGVRDVKWPTNAQYELETKYGPLSLHVVVNGANEGATAYARFLKEGPEGFPHLAHINPYTGKWNHHFFVHPDGHDRAVESFRRDLSGIVPPKEQVSE